MSHNFINMENMLAEADRAAERGDVLIGHLVVAIFAGVAGAFWRELFDLAGALTRLAF